MSHPIPRTISPEAQAALAASDERGLAPSPAAADDVGWRALGAFAATTDPATVDALAMATTGAVPTDVEVAIEEHAADGARYFVGVPDGLDAGDDRVLFCIHGGGFTFGGGETARRSTMLLAGDLRVRTYGMDYRELPDHPFPAGLDDCMAVYRQLLDKYQPGSIAFIGQSGGANLSMALLLRAHDEGLPMPAAAALISPPVDLTESGDTYSTNAFTVAQGGLTSTFERYRGTFTLDHPYISPLFGDLPADLPPIILTAGTRDFLLSDTVRLHRALLKSGVHAELHVWEGAPHGMFMGRAPEDVEQIEQIRSFLDAAWSTSPSPR